MFPSAVTSTSDGLIDSKNNSDRKVLRLETGENNVSDTASAVAAA